MNRPNPTRATPDISIIMGTVIIGIRSLPTRDGVFIMASKELTKRLPPIRRTPPNQILINGSTEKRQQICCLSCLIIHFSIYPGLKSVAITPGTLTCAQLHSDDPAYEWPPTHDGPAAVYSFVQQPSTRADGQRRHKLDHIWIFTGLFSHVSPCMTPWTISRAVNRCRPLTRRSGGVRRDTRQVRAAAPPPPLPYYPIGRRSSSAPPRPVPA